MVDTLIKLFDSASTSFSSNGLGGLPDASRCVVKEERNGSYPINGKRYNDICLRKIIVAPANKYSGMQAFRIYSISKPINGLVTIRANHISYDLSGYPASPFSASSVTDAFLQIKSHSVLKDCPFDFTTYKTTAAEFTNSFPSSIRSLLGGNEGSILDIYGGEYEFDNFSVKLHENRGTNRGATIRYGKNLLDLEQEESCDSLYTGVYPYWYSDTEGLMELVEKIVKAEGNYNFQHILPLNLSDEWEEKPTEDMLRQKAVSYMKNVKIGEPKVSLTVSFAELSQSGEYEKFAPLQDVRLCDTVTVEYPQLNVKATAKCISTTYNVLTGRYDEIEIGDARSTLAATIANQESSIKKAPSRSFMEKAIDNATKLITGGLGGYVVIRSSSGGEYPDEILIMDTDDILTATNVWRWNKGGLGYSSSGYNGPYTTAITQDGSIVADFITAGELSGAILKADSVKTSSLSVEFVNSLNTAFANLNVANDEIRAEVKKKIGSDEISTAITQNAESVRIAWNNISNYIEFSGGALNIYEDVARGDDNLLMKLNSSGAWYYNGGTRLGKVGTNKWSGDSSFRGIVFDLEYEGNYMCWAAKDSKDASSYTTKLIYFNDNKKDKKGLHFGCETYCGGYLYINDNVKSVSYTDGSGGLMSQGNALTLNGDGTSVRITKEALIFGNTSETRVDCYNNIDLHNYSILNQSDARLKENIMPTSIKALDILNNIQLMSFDWIESNEHCDVGIVAQQLKDILPEMVHENRQTGRLSIKSDKLIPYIIKAVQELSAAILSTKMVNAISRKNVYKEWIDPYSDVEKREFASRNSVKQSIKPIEVKAEPIYIPVNRKENIL